MDDADGPFAQPRVPLRTIAWQWSRLGLIGFGGPPTHIALLRRLCVEEQKWMQATEFEDGIAATNLLPGPASTQLAIFCAGRLRGIKGAILGGICFILPGFVIIVLLSAVFLARHPADWVLGAAAGAGAAVPAVALKAASALVNPSRTRLGGSTGAQFRWFVYAILGAVAAATVGPYLVVVLLGCGLIEIASSRALPGHGAVVVGVLAGHVVAAGGLAALAWVAFKVGALSYGGGFVIVPLMQHDAVSTYHWMTGSQFLNAVALGQITPGPVVLTVAVVGYAARGLRGALLATVIAFTPSFLFVVVGGPRFDRIRSHLVIQSFLSGAGPAAVGAIAGSSIPLGLAFREPWQVALLVGALLWLLVARRGVVSGLLLAAGVGTALALVGVAV